ncbi:sigma-E factor regulatory protein RseB [Alteromonas aestuariivivens]|uniref:Sigma-E factor regulatory protein RseB n=1 Tax=Alteromonas aestuariivivens TaxID=1938339 RepID=A0A3D8MFD2_9ALTE|nr:MucB/RseB C-terminal domain-containing protein [Alteromonas aestuariivivens]RDV29336.1 sigma-E factor regulatory protein RseB [Alteromonas aestuariivivens]
MNIPLCFCVPALNRLVHVFLRGSKFFAASFLALSLPIGAQTADYPDSVVSESQAAPVEPFTEEGVASRPVMTARDWLLRLTHATRQLNFQATLVQSRAGQETIPFLWRHGVMEEGLTMEQLSLQNGPGRELIRVGNVVSVFEPDVPPYSLHSPVINGPIPSELLYAPDSLRTGYEFVLVGRARIAGRPAQQLRIVSRDNSRFSYQLWLDEATGMPLKLNMLDLQGSLLEQIQITSLSIQEEPPAYFTSVNQASLPRPMAIVPKQPRQHQWEVDYLPSGMTEVRRDIRRLALTGQVVEYKMFSDGLVDVSVYVQSAAEALGSDLVLRHELNTFLTLTDGQAQVTVVGEIPLKTANAIATSLRLKGEGE